MSENEAKSTRKRTHYPDRVTLSVELLAKVDGWIAQTVVRKKGVRLNRKDIVLWKLEQATGDLSEAELQELAARFYDEERFLLDLLRDVKSAKARGEKVSLDALELQDVPKIRKKRRSKLATDLSGESSLPVNSDAAANSVTSSE